MKNSYLDQVVEEQQQLEQNMKARRQVQSMAPMQARGGAAMALPRAPENAV